MAGSSRITLKGDIDPDSRKAIVHQNFLFYYEVSVQYEGAGVCRYIYKRTSIRSKRGE